MIDQLDWQLVLYLDNRERYSLDLGAVPVARKTLQLGDML